MSIDGKRSTPRQGFAFRNTYDMLTSVDILAFGLQGSVVQRAVTTQRNEELAFAVLADQVRRQILDTLASHGECSAGFISDQISTVGRTTVSTHLRALRLSGVVLERRQGRHRLYSIDRWDRPTMLCSSFVVCSNAPWERRPVTLRCRRRSIRTAAPYVAGHEPTCDL